VIPIEESLIYVWPLYLRAENGKIPELKRVVVAYKNSIAMAETLEASLAKIFGAVTPNQPTNPPTATLAAAPPTPDVTSLANQANEHYQRAIKAQRDGDWALYGDEIKKLGAVIEQMQSKK